MAENQPFDGDNLVQTSTTFSQLLFDDDEDDHHHHHQNQIFNYSVSDSSSFPIQPPPKMLCFSNKQQNQQHPHLLFNFSSDSLDSKLKRRNGSNPETATIKASKKNKADAPYSGHAKRKEKLGERITALQQLVSPFGKTDTASVLHEAMGYIKFLQEQVEVLCSPYLKQRQVVCFESASGKREREKDLKSKGLCLIPVEWSLHLADCTMADFWSPAMAMGKNL